MDIWQFKIPTEDLLKVSSIAHQIFFLFYLKLHTNMCLRQYTSAEALHIKLLILLFTNIAAYTVHIPVHVFLISPINNYI